MTQAARRSVAAEPFDAVLARGAPEPPLAAEMINHALRRGRDRPRDDDAANVFFAAIAHTCPEWFAGSRILWTPTARSPELRRAIAHVRLHLETASIETTASAANLSARKLRRRFHDEFWLCWRSFIREVRMNRAMELLSREQLSVTQTAFAVSFSSIRAFTVAFATHSGQSPRTFCRQFRR
ncbi:MAG: helix-turn-helix transcriptional regulator [Acetobacteraceae bacterium]